MIRYQSTSLNLRINFFLQKSILNDSNTTIILNLKIVEYLLSIKLCLTKSN